MVIDCISIANKILNKAHQDFESFKKRGINPKMVVIKINDDKASEKYVSFKIKKAQELGIQAEIIGNDIKNEKQLIDKIIELNNDDSIHGYIIQLPLPVNFDREKIFEYIDIRKDIDGLSNLAVSRNTIGSKLFHPKACTANGIVQIIKDVGYELEGKNIVIINASVIVGIPLFGQLLSERATVTICHSKTKNLAEITKKADVIISAVGVPNFITKEMVDDNAFVVDVGINVFNNKIVGDVKFDEVSSKVKYITPVPNGVGKLTVAMIFKNLVDLIKEQYNERI